MGDERDTEHEHTTGRRTPEPFLLPPRPALVIPWDAATADRAAGVLMGMACGDALGAPYELGPPLADEAPVGMVGGGPFGWAPGEWTDDTQMAVVLLEAAERAVALDRTLLDLLDDVALGWVAWSRTAQDVGAQTRAVLSAAGRDRTPTAARLAHAAAAHHERTGRSGGNGSLMRTAPVALAFLGDPRAMAHAARTVSALTHHDPEAGDACVLWCAAIRHAVLTGRLDVRVGLDLLPAERGETWRSRLAEAEGREPASFERNGWVVEAVQSAWSAIAGRGAPPEPDDAGRTSDGEEHLRTALERAVRGGGDTDTVAAIAGSLLGARWGASAIPTDWLGVVHGWPGRLRVTELGRRGLAVARRATDTRPGPQDPGPDTRDEGGAPPADPPTRPTVTS